MGKFLIPPNPIEAFLNTVIVDNKFIFINMWSFVHIFAGMLIAFVIEKYFPTLQNPLVVLGLLVAYEIFEILLWGTLFRPEKLTDIIWDLIFGMIGYFIGLKILGVI